MGWESFGVVRFDLGPLLQGQTRIAKLVFISCLFVFLEVAVSHQPIGNHGLRIF